jgi:intermediate peptidase
VTIPALPVKPPSRSTDVRSSDNSEVWSQFLRKSHNPATPRTGLFQNKDLTSPAGFRKYANRTLAKAKQLGEKIVNASTQDELVRVVQDLDRLSDLLCRVIDMSDFVRATHPDRAVVMAAHEAYGAMFEYMNVLNTTTGLYTTLKRALEDPEVLKRYTAEERVVAEILFKDFEKSGINLPAYVRRRWVELTSEIAELGAVFINDMQPEKGMLQFDSSRMKGMDPMVARELTQRGRVKIPTIGMAANHALRTVEDPQVRKELYLANHTSSARQIEVLEDLLKRRAELGTLVGCDSYGQHGLMDKMAKTPEAVMQFLQSLATANLPAAQAELSALSQLKHNHGIPGALEPWDRDYYATKLTFALRSRSKSDHDLPSYFSLGTVMQGLSRVFTRLYGVRFIPREPSPGETWNEDVRRLDVVSETEGHIAVVYCDLFEREGKNPNPAHFTVRCSRRLPEDEIAEEALNGERADDGMASARRQDTGELYQLPTIALICDFPRPTHAGKPTLLNFREVQTLFHEMGHAVHSMLGRTSLHNVAGTRCATDWAELPSVLMEHFAKDPHVLALFARHYSTDEPLPYQMLQERLARDSLLEATETRHQIILALLDQHYYSHRPLEKGFSSTAVYRDVEREFSLLPHPEGTSWQGFFGHLYGYGATYYAYLFDRAIAARIWKDVFESGPLERERGETFRSEVLRWGGARSGWRCLAGVLQRPELGEGGEEAMKEVGRWGSELK